MNSNKGIVLGGLVVLALVVCGFFVLRGGSPAAGAATLNPTGPAHYQMEAFQQGATFGLANQSYFDGLGRFRLGASGTLESNYVVTTCSIKSDASAAATSTVYGYCTGVTGVTSADYISASFATTSTLMTDQWVISGAKASTTAAAIDFRLMNLTGAARAFSANSTIGSSTVIRASH